MEGAAALILPTAEHHRQRRDGMHGDGPVARPSEAVADAEEGARASPQQMRQGRDVVGRHAADRRRPFGRAGREMGFEPCRIVGIAIEIGAVREAVAEQHMHDAAGQRAVRARSHDQRDIGLAQRGIVVDVDRDDGRAPGFARPHRMRHDVDLGHHRIGAPEHDAIGPLHLARISAGHAAVARHVAGPGKSRANGGILVRNSAWHGAGG